MLSLPMPPSAEPLFTRLRLPPRHAEFSP
jgi:hypothetical protein